MKTLKKWFSTRYQALIQRLDARARANQAQQVAMPPLSKKTWRLYADISLQAFKTLTYYVVAALAILLVFGGGLFAGYFASIVAQTEVPTQKAMKQTLSNVEQSTNLYFANNVELAHIKSDLIRDTVTLGEMSPFLTDAIIATEDEDFYTNAGVSPKSVIRAVSSEFTGLGNQTGGSTLTQQVVKLQFLSAETTFKRKVTEIMYALRLNHFFSKQNILESYLNIVTLGRNNKGQNIAGVETAAQGLFGKTAKDLTLPQAAFIAGLPQSPSVYTPYTNTGKLKKDLSAGIDRQHTVLFRMYRAGKISKKDYDAAKAYDLKADFLTRGTAAETQDAEYSYVYNLVADEAKTILAQQLAKADGHSVAAYNQDKAMKTQYLTTATDLLTSKGYQVHSTINKQVYDAMQGVMNTSKAEFGRTYTNTELDPKTGQTVTTKDPVQNGSILLDNQSGAVLGFVGGVSGELNHIRTTRSPGSAIKPLLVYGPAVEHKLIGTQTMLADFKTHFPNNYTVTDYGGVIKNQFTPAATALAESDNIPVVNLYNTMRKSVDVKPYMEKMGVTTLTANDYSQLGLALGGTDYGVSVEAQASAFSTFENNGEHMPAYVIDKIIDPGGNVVYQHKGQATKVFSPSTTYIMQQMLHGVVTKGTASSLAYALSFNTDNVIGKTGTTNDYKDVWFVGATPGVTLASWMGYDNNNGEGRVLASSAGDTNLTYWARLANATYRIIPDAFKTDKAMARPADVKSTKVNKNTGMKAGKVTFDGNTYTVSGETATSLTNGWEPGATTADFGIGGTKENYQSFWADNSGGPRRSRMTTADEEDSDTD